VFGLTPADVFLTNGRFWPGRLTGYGSMVTEGFVLLTATAHANMRFVRSFVEPLVIRRPPTPAEGPAGRGTMGESTQDLLDLARHGDQPALTRLYERYRIPLLRWARGRLPSSARDLRDTSDLVQEAMLQTFRRLDEFEHRGPGALGGYLREAVLNRVRDEIRRAGRRPGVVPLDPSAADSSPSPLEAAVGSEALARYDAALARLPVAEREVIVARVEMGCDYAAIADMFSKPSADAARMAVSRALVHLAEEMHRGR